jgi:hypothetical protein
MTRINLGDTVRDTISGFTGIVIARCEWLYGCVRISVQPTSLDKDGKVQDHVTFDEQQLVVVTASQQKESESTSGPGGPREEVSRGNDIAR